MNCSEIEAHLSSYYDGELSSDEQSAVARHLAECRECALQHADFESCSRAIRQMARPAVPAELWQKLAGELSQADSDERPRNEPRRSEEPATTATGGSMRQTPALLAAAASLLLLVGVGLWMSEPAGRNEQVHAGHREDFATTMDAYLEMLSTDPDRAERFLMEQYRGKAVVPGEAGKLIGYRPAVAEGLPTGYSLASTSILKMPCCTCVKAVCKRSDGTNLVLFEHDDETAAWFGDRSTRMMKCGDEACCLVDLDQSIAATWQHGSRSITAVGAHDRDEVERLVEWLKKRTPSAPTIL